MTTEDLARIGSDMRHAQTEYFRSRSSSALNNARRLEAKFDRCLAHILNQEPTLFDMEEQ